MMSVLERPALGVILVGEDAGARSYAAALKKAAGLDDALDVQVHQFGIEATRSEVAACLKQLNRDDAVHGILGLTPVPDNCWGVYDDIDRFKDVDCQTPQNFDDFMAGKEVPFLPATAEAVANLIPAASRRVAVVGLGKAVGAPLLEILKRRDGVKVTGIETHPEQNPTWDVDLRYSMADTVVGAAGFLPHGLTADNLPPEVRSVIDVAYCEKADQTVVGNFDFESPQALSLLHKVRPHEVGQATVKQLLEHVKQAQNKVLAV